MVLFKYFFNYLNIVKYSSSILKRCKFIDTNTEVKHKVFLCVYRECTRLACILLIVIVIACAVPLSTPRAISHCDLHWAPEVITGQGHMRTSWAGMFCEVEGVQSCVCHECDTLITRLLHVDDVLITCRRW